MKADPRNRGRRPGLLQTLLRGVGRLSVLFAKQSQYLPHLYAGVEVTTDGLCQLLKGSFHRVAVAAVSNGAVSELSGGHSQNADAGMHTWNGYPVYVAPRLIESLEQALVERAPDVVVLQEFDLPLWTSMEHLLIGFPVIFYQHSLFPSLHELFQDEGLQARKGTTFLGSSRLIGDYALLSGLGSRIVPPLFGMEKYKNGQRSGHEIVMVSIQVNKGTDIALEIARQRPQYSFVFLDSWTNSADEKSRLISEIRQLPNATVLPSVPDMSPIFKNAQLLLMPSRYEETWGRVATEAQLFGIPVLGSNRGHLGDTIGPGGVALDPEADIKTWLMEFDRILEEPATFKKLAFLAKAHSRQTLRQASTARDDFVTAMYSVLDHPPLLTRVWNGRCALRREPLVV